MQSRVSIHRHGMVLTLVLHCCLDQLPGVLEDHVLLVHCLIVHYGVTSCQLVCVLLYDCLYVQGLRCVTYC